MATEAPEQPATQETPAASPPPPAATQKAPPAPKADAKKQKGEKKDAKGEKKGKQAGKGAEPSGDGPSVAAHPRAARGVARAKSWGGLIGFVLGGYLSLPTHTLAETGLRALSAGVIGYVAAWAGAVFVWRRLVILELKHREHKLLTAVQARQIAQHQPSHGTSAGVGETAGARAGS